jgi:hypothetical protein
MVTFSGCEIKNTAIKLVGRLLETGNIVEFSTAVISYTSYLTSLENETYPSVFQKALKSLLKCCKCYSVTDI